VSCELIDVAEPSLTRNLWDLHVGGAAACALPAGRRESLRFLRADEARLRFSSSDTPSLEKLMLMVGAKSIWKEIVQLPRLWALQVGPADDSVVAALSVMPLEILLVRRGKLSDLRPLSTRTGEDAVRCSRARDVLRTWRGTERSGGRSASRSFGKPATPRRSRGDTG
jgi:hypothetical protein